MITRIAPVSDDHRWQALTACRAQADALDEAKWLITPEQYEAVGTELAAWNEVRGTAATALARQVAATRAGEEAFEVCATTVVHFMHVLHLAIRRRKIMPGERVGYGLPAGRARVPAINTACAAVEWARTLAAGEAARVAKGGLPLAWPDIGEVTAAAAVLEERENALSLAKEAHQKAREAVAARRPGVQALVRDLADTIEFYLRRHDAPSRRRVAREWGVRYVTRPANKRRKAQEAPAEPAPAEEPRI